MNPRLVQEVQQPDLWELIRRYYQHRTVRERMCEFLGSTNLRSSPAAYITGTDGYSDYGSSHSPEHLGEYLNAGLEVDRSLWDRDSLLVDIDLEHHNFDQPDAAWQDPRRAFRIEQPVLDATLQVLRSVGVTPLTLVSGRGFHLVWAIRRSSRAFQRLVQRGWVPASLEARYEQTHSPGGWRIDPELGRAFSGLGLILEFVAHRVLAEATGKCEIPVQLTAIEVGPGANGREIVSFDLSEYGDPLHSRHVRIPFSVYLKPRQMQGTLREEGIGHLLPIFEVPLNGMTIDKAIVAARDPKAVVELSRRISVAIPNASEATEGLLDVYERSELAAFHREFNDQIARQEREPAALPSSLSTRISGAPECVKWFLENPNDWLLKPAVLQHIVRILTALRWTPAAISQLICSRYHCDSNWGGVWTRLEPMNRAVFYTRLFSGMIATGTDALIDLNCVSQQEKGYCKVPDCSSNLVTYRNMLLERRAP